jgi:hypothetical protein
MDWFDNPNWAFDGMTHAKSRALALRFLLDVARCESYNTCLNPEVSIGYHPMEVELRLSAAQWIKGDTQSYKEPV